MQQMFLLLITIASIAVAIFFYMEGEEEREKNEQFERRQDELEARIAAEEAEQSQTIYIPRPYPVYYNLGVGGRRRGHFRRRR